MGKYQTRFTIRESILKIFSFFFCFVYRYKNDISLKHIKGSFCVLSIKLIANLFIKNICKLARHLVPISTPNTFA